MRRVLFAAIVTWVVASTSPASGEGYRLVRVRDSQESSGNGSSNSSTHDADELLQRVIARRANGVEFEYDMPPDSPDRPSVWQLPARIFLPTNGPAILLNRDQLAARVDPWLKKAGLTRASCGKLIFTWNTFLIDCDPASALGLIAAFTLPRNDVRPGTTYSDSDAAAPGILQKTATGSLKVLLQVDPERLRRALVNQDLQTRQLMRRPADHDQVAAAHSADRISGTIAIDLALDRDGVPYRRTKVMTTIIVGADGNVRRRRVTETLERQLIH